MSKFVNAVVVDEFGINLASKFLTNRPAPYNDMPQVGRRATWGLSYAKWRALRAELISGTKPATVCSKYMTLAGLDFETEKNMFYNGFQVTFPGQTVTTMRALNKTLKLQGIRL